MLSREGRLFFLGWLKNPWRVGVPVASSRSLARAMAAQLQVKPHDYVLELGAGTGAVTRAILHAGIRPEKLIIIERDQGFIDQLRRDFPGVILIKGDARHLRELLLERNITALAAVVSSLPLLNMPQILRQAIIQSCFALLGDGGAYVQYTYGLRSPLPMPHQQALGIRGRIASHVWRNFPPARVWRYTVEAEPQGSPAAAKQHVA